MSYIPPYSYFYNNGRNPYSTAKALPEASPRRRNGLWSSYGMSGIILGSILTLVGISMIPIEIARIMTGSLNRATTGSYRLYPNYNFDKDSGDSVIRLFEKDIDNTNVFSLDRMGVVPFSATSATATLNTAANYPVQDKYVWPWSHAALFFSIIIIAAGMVGILSGCRGTYTSVFAFFTLSLLSALLSSFLIAYYAVHVRYQNTANLTNRGLFEFHSRDFSFGVVMLILSSVAEVVSIAAAVWTALTLRICCGSKAPLLKANGRKRLPAANDPRYFRENPFMPPPGFVAPQPYLS